MIRDSLSSEVLLAQSLRSAAQDDLAALLREVRQALPVPAVAVVSHRQESIRLAVAKVFPGVPHQLCLHYLREAVWPPYETARYAEKELKKPVRGVRPLDYCRTRR